VKRYYDCWLVCDDPSCGRRTTQQSVRGFNCTENCHGRMVQEYDEAALHTQLKCLESLFDVSRLQAKKKLSDVALKQFLSDEQRELMKILKQVGV
jgi:DNA polymerase alpha subunit A